MYDNEIMRTARRTAQRERLRDAWVMIGAIAITLAGVAYSLAPIWW
jgi:hypothetical protein